MPLGERMTYNNFVEYQDIIEERWTAGDRLNEIVFIGIDINEIEIRKQLEKCCNANEIIDLYKTDVSQR
jgi:G3E family GTPase